MLKTLENIKHLDENNFFLIAGPCVVENEKMCFEIAEHIIMVTDKLKIPFLFKASYKKANRSSSRSFTGIGDEMALKILEKIRTKLKIPIVTDVHSTHEAVHASNFVDVLQIPAFLARQTDLIEAAAKTGCIVNIKKGQFMSPQAMQFAASKAIDCGNNKVMLTERGTMFGYQDLIVDFRGIYEMKKNKLPVILDITHSLQKPNQESGVSGGTPELIETLGLAGVATGVDGIFIETHPNPSVAKSDGTNMLKMDKLEDLLLKLVKIRKTINTL